MKLDMTAPITDLDGSTPLITPEGASLVLRAVIQTALTAQLKGDEALDGASKVKLWTLAVAANEDAVDWPVEDVALVKQRVGEGWGVKVVGPAFRLLDA